MILESVRLHPFAGIQDRTVHFSPRLTVVSGPNEAGKSTLYRGIRCVLFEPVVLTRKQFERTMGEYLPTSGGDVIRVDARAQVQSEGGEETSTFEIRKVWKHAHNAGSATLIQPGGGEVSDPARAHQTLQTLLPCRQATFENILLSRQAGLHETVAGGITPESSEEIGAVVRSAIMETGGVSLERFFAELERRVHEFYAHWDRTADYPEKGKGIDSPWKKEVGAILRAYYEQERLRRDLQAVRSWETELADVEAQLRELESEWETLDSEYRRYTALQEEIQRRATLERELEAIDAKLERLADLTKRWPIEENRLAAIPGEREKIAAELKAIETRLEQAQRARQRAGAVERAKRAKVLADKVDEAQKALEKLPEISGEKLERLRTLTAEVERLSATIAASKLSLSLSAPASFPGAGEDSSPTEDSRRTDNPARTDNPPRTDTPPRTDNPARTDGAETLEVTIVRADDSHETVRLHANDVRDLTADGRIQLSYAGLAIRVSAGSGELDEAVERRNACLSERAALLAALGVSDLEEAQALAEQYNTARQQLKYTRESLEAELGGQPYDEVVAPLSEPEVAGTAEDPDALQEAAAEARQNLRSLDSEADALRGNIAEWEGEFGTWEKLNERTGELRYRRTQATTELGTLAALPEGFSRTEEFVEYTRKLAGRREELQARLSEARQKKSGIEARAPEESAEELGERLSLAAQRFSHVKEQGEALLRVSDRAHKLSDELDSDTWQPLQRRFSRWLEYTTHGRFRRVHMEAAETTGFVTQHGNELTPGQLSWGTRDSVALALRMTLAEYAAGAGGGFVIFDDPLVEMDPSRRALACQALSEFSESCQTIVLTCHPEHAAELGGTHVLLGQSE